MPDFLLISSPYILMYKNGIQVFDLTTETYIYEQQSMDSISNVSGYMVVGNDYKKTLK